MYTAKSRACSGKRPAAERALRITNETETAAARRRLHAEGLSYIILYT